MMIVALMMKSKLTIPVVKNRKISLIHECVIVDCCSGTAVHGNGPRAGADRTLKSIFSKATAQQSRPSNGKKKGI